MTDAHMNDDDAHAADPYRGDPSRWQQLLGVALMSSTLLATLLILAGSFSKHPGLRNFGTVVAIPAILYAMLPFACALLLIGIWTTRGAARFFRAPSVGRAYDVVEVPPMPVPSPQTHEVVKPLSDAEILRILNGGLDRHRAPVDWISGSSRPAEVVQRSTAGVAATIVPDGPLTTSENLRIGKLSDDSYVIQLRPTATNSAEATIAECERASVAFMEQPDHTKKKMVVDAQHLKPEESNGLVRMVFDLFKQFGVMAGEKLRVHLSREAKDDLFSSGHLWKWIERHFSEDVQRVAVLAACLAIFFGPVPL